MASHPAVMEVAVIAIPHEHWGEVPKAFVTLKPGMRASEEDIIDHVRGRLAHFKAPQVRCFRRAPKDFNGQNSKVRLAGSGVGRFATAH